MQRSRFDSIYLTELRRKKAIRKGETFIVLMGGDDGSTLAGVGGFHW